jgi:hypothetical protein
MDRSKRRSDGHLQLEPNAEGRPVIRRRFVIARRRFAPLRLGAILVEADGKGVTERLLKPPRWGNRFASIRYPHDA